MTTAARHLHTLLEQVQEAEGANVRVRWQAVLEAEPYSTTFALRHAAVTSLWRETVGVINALPASATRDRRLTYAEQWWRAVTMPDVHWGDNQRHEIIDQAALDMLDATAEYLEQLDGGTQAAPVGALDALRAQAEEWVARVETAAGLSRGLTASLLEHLHNLIWLIDNADRFGVSPVISAAEQVSGGLLRTAMSTMQPGKWAGHLGKFVAAITLVATGLTQTNLAIDQGQDLYREIEAAAQHQPDPDTPPADPVPAD